MRKTIGWQEKTDDLTYRIRVLFHGGHVLWRRITKDMERWAPFEPTPAHWQHLLEKTKRRYLRRQAPYKVLQLIERLAAEAAAQDATAQDATPPPPP
ncbi:MAG: hypothetical protein PHO14_07235 [Kiritimatiellae bacterium]|jgi:hypothetical protein|nr:hypothetical protein [Kiritimatiellia bacterium]MDD4342011.1 hypothetical protein [Kiritimatiellia bacterium]MDY0149277.1 hypothetical protein [Kiritimatiellia bacterium]